MNALESLRLALHQVWAHKLKSSFSVVGVIIGITFLIVVITLVEGMNRYVREDFAGSVFGVNTFTVVQRPQRQLGPLSDEERRRWADAPHLTLHDVQVVREAAEDPLYIAHYHDRFLNEVSHRERRRKNVRVVGGSEDYTRIQGWHVEQGRGLTPLDHRRALKVAVLGPQISEKLFPTGPESAVGRRIRLAGHRFRVVGIFERRGGLTGNVRDAAILLPYATYQETVGRFRRRVEGIQVKVRRADGLASTMATVEGALRADRGLRPGTENNFYIQTRSQIVAVWETINRILITALPGLVSVALVVGGIVIMNIMLVSVTQRTREIGIRKALGARQRDINFQFLLEATVQALVGAALGIAAGVGLAGLIARVSPLPAAVPVWAVTLGVALGLVVGIASGLLPARRAARLDPVDALRHE